MQTPEIEALAEGILKSLELWRLPVDPLAIAAEEEILLRPGVYSTKFDARIEYYPQYGRFCIFYRNYGLPIGRIRFSLAHELGHYYLPDHQARLRNNVEHNSKSGYRSRDPHERQADEFAAALLMPRELFTKKVQAFGRSVCDLPDLVKLAHQLQTSIASTALRYCTSDLEPCTVVFSEGGTVQWTASSQDMRYFRMSYIAPGTHLPSGSKSAELTTSLGRERVDGKISAHLWFENPGHAWLWEDSMVLGDSTYLITLLTPYE